MSKKLLPAEMNYPTHERELLAIVCALIQTQPHLSARQRELGVNSYIKR